MSGHVASLKSYVLIFLALLVLMALTTGVAFIDLGPLNTVVALAIAGCKMMLVVLFFMHILYSKNLTKIVAAAGLLWLMILLMLTMSDFATRKWTPSPAGWNPAGKSTEGPSVPGAAATPAEPATESR
jgi:cytochrome c oxidase subunit 4